MVSWKSFCPGRSRKVTYNISEADWHPNHRLPSDVADDLRRRDPSASRKNPALSRYLAGSAPQTRPSSPEVEEPESTLTPDQGQTDLFRPPFHSSDDTRMRDPSLNSQNSSGASPPSLNLGSRMATTSWSVFPSLASQAGYPFHLSTPNHSDDTQNQIPTYMVGSSQQNRTVPAGHVRAVSTSDLADLSSFAFPVIPDDFGADTRGSQDIWSAIFGDFQHSESVQDAEQPSIDGMDGVMEVLEAAQAAE